MSESEPAFPPLTTKQKLLKANDTSKDNIVTQPYDMKNEDILLLYSDDDIHGQLKCQGQMNPSLLKEEAKLQTEECEQKQCKVKIIYEKNCLQ